MKEDILAMRETTDDADESQDASADATSGHSLGQPLPLYDPLSKDHDCTRLLRIEAAGDGDPIICTLSEVSFGDKPQFDALSYMWGHGKAEQKITINGHDFNVRQNLWDVLHYLRKHCRDTSYWIDAICINQNDIDERNRQVRIMHHIYFRAQTVAVWLGQGYARYEAQVPHLRRLCHMNAQIEETTSESIPEPTQTGSSVRNLAVELCNDSYWKRLWIIQEIGLAREIKVCFGNCAIEWRQFTQFLVTNGLGSEGPMKLEKQRQDKYTGANTLLHLLQAHRESECQDRKDKVYGLLGMASDARGFVIDYNKSLFEIWTDVMEFMNWHSLFSNQDIISVGSLVKFLLMGAECDPLQQVLRTYAPGDRIDTLIKDTNSIRSFQFTGAMLGCVIHVGPQPQEIIGKLKEVDSWVQRVQANYKDDLGNAHKESDWLISTILDLDDESLSRKCFDCRSTIQGEWRGDYSEREAMEWAEDFQRSAQEVSKNHSPSIAQVSTNSPRLFQMAVRGRAPWRMGLSSSDLQVGDLICWLQFPRRAVVVRRYSNRPRWKLQVVGTAVITADIREMTLGHSQRQGWNDGYTELTIFLDARTIFVLLAD